MDCVNYTVRSRARNVFFMTKQGAPLQSTFRNGQISRCFTGDIIFDYSCISTSFFLGVGVNDCWISWCFTGIIISTIVANVGVCYGKTMVQIKSFISRRARTRSRSRTRAKSKSSSRTGKKTILIILIWLIVLWPCLVFSCRIINQSTYLCFLSANCNGWIMKEQNL